MQQAITYAPKMNSVPEICFSAREAELKKLFNDYPVGKILFVSDGSSFGLFSGAVHSPRALAVVLDGDDALPLFCMPDGIACVAVSGRRETLLATRGYAAICGVPTVLFPVDASLYGVFDGQTQLLTNGVRGEVKLNDGRVVYDEKAITPSLGRALAGLYLSRLALFETRALSILKRTELPDAFEEAFGLLDTVKGDAEEIIAKNARLRVLERDGLPVGEGAALANLLRGSEDAPWRAFLLLSSLYAAFFKRGKPRRYRVPDYSARFLAAGIAEGYLTANIPTAEEYSRRALALERGRGELLREINALTDRRAEYLFRLRRYMAAEDAACELGALSRLPEVVPSGLSAIIRDFGLMEEL
ncbi:MAG: hypothetical protein K2L87_02320 [Clostridiales bacterium]|nr:hypothetical protein [Clostridiales bacterium]